MIIKSLSRRQGTKQVINYLFKDKDKLSNKNFKPLVIRHNVRARNLDKVVNEFEANNSLRKVNRKDGIKVYHTIISFGKKDKEKITEKALRDFAKKYMELQGKDNMYIMTQHIEKDHIHLHCVMSGTRYLTGVANRLSKKEFSQLKLDMQAYQKQKYPELNKSLPEHGKGKNKGYTRDSRMNKKNTLDADLQKAYQQSKSTKDFLSQIKSLGHEPYYRNEKLTGIKFDGETKFRLNKLGYDAEKMKALDNQDNKEREQLEELESIRNSTDSRERESDDRGRFIDEDDKDDNREDNKLDEEDEPDDDHPS